MFRTVVWMRYSICFSVCARMASSMMSILLLVC
ncbi:hypothetical protein LINGRAPRIM_LOCUS1585 [Linum grandiflorum]